MENYKVDIQDLKHSINSLQSIFKRTDSYTDSMWTILSLAVAQGPQAWFIDNNSCDQVNMNIDIPKEFIAKLADAFEPPKDISKEETVKMAIVFLIEEFMKVGITICSAMITDKVCGEKDGIASGTPLSDLLHKLKFAYSGTSTSSQTSNKDDE